MTLYNFNAIIAFIMIILSAIDKDFVLSFMSLSAFCGWLILSAIERKKQ